MSLVLIPPSDPRLWTAAAPVTDIAAQVEPYIAEMKALMTEHDGMGLSANQCGLQGSWFVMAGPRGFEVFINPILLEEKGWNASGLEGCLSFPGKRTYVPRRQIVRLSWTDIMDQPREDTFILQFARCALHEVSHLKGECIFPRPSEKS